MSNFGKKVSVTGGNKIEIIPTDEFHKNHKKRGIIAEFLYSGEESVSQSSLDRSHFDEEIEGMQIFNITIEDVNKILISENRAENNEDLYNSEILSV